MPCNIGTWLPIVIIMPVTMLSKGCLLPMVCLLLRSTLEPLLNLAFIL